MQVPVKVSFSAFHPIYHTNDRVPVDVCIWTSPLKYTVDGLLIAVSISIYGM